MFYSFWLTIPANTSQASPAKLSVKLTAGQLERVEVFFPDGLAGLVYGYLLHQEHQLLPTNPDGYFSGNNQRYIIPMDYEIKSYATNFKLCGWSDDDSYDQPIEFCFLVTRPGPIPAWFKKLLKVG